MSEPTVVCVMLVNGRRAMALRAVESFKAQTYKRKRLLVWNTGEDWPLLRGQEYMVGMDWGISEPRVDATAFEGATIGRLRNAANKYALAHYTTNETRADLIAHWDSDDWSHLHRLEEQVAFLQSQPGKDCVGYNELLFWETREIEQSWIFCNQRPGYLVGASMLYKREAWERCKFSETEKHEDYHWWLKNAAACASKSACINNGPDSPGPRLVCEIHGNNTSGAYAPNKMRPPEWRRGTPHMDRWCAEVMAL